jgi:hypothetical protein
LMDGTPIFDIKPYLTYADCHEGARSGFVDRHAIRRLEVKIPQEIEKQLGRELCDTLRHVLSLDPRPHYQDNPDKIYGMPFYGMDVHFSVDEHGVLQVRDIVSEE